jgi:hypothetical protein
MKASNKIQNIRFCNRYIILFRRLLKPEAKLYNDEGYNTANNEMRIDSPRKCPINEISEHLQLYDANTFALFSLLAVLNS